MSAQLFPDPSRLVSLDGRWVLLRPITPFDYPELYRWRCNLDTITIWSGITRNVPNFEEFKEEISAWMRSAICMVAVDKHTSALCGIRRAFNVDLLNSYAYTQTYVVPEYRLRPHAAEAVLLFDDYLFRHFPFRKLFVEVYEFDETLVRTFDRIGLECEGRLKEKSWYDYRYWDVLVYSVGRQVWDDMLEKWETVLSIEDDISKIGEAVSRLPAKRPGQT